jgi:peptidoglycan DL-endopeptidase CwlO
VRTRRSGSTTLIRTLRYGAAGSLGMLAVGALILSTGVAGAAPQPTVAEVQAKLAQLNTQAQKLDEQFAQAQQQLAAANQQLAAVNTEVARDESQLDLWQGKVAEIAMAAYENGSLSSPTALLTSDDPQALLDQSSILQELASSNNSEIKAYLAAARQLLDAQQAAKRVQAGKLALKDELAREKATNAKLTSQQQALLNQLTPAQQAAVGPTSQGGSTVGQDPLPATTQALKAVQFAYDQLGCPYVFGGTGPCNDGFDCSGLMMQAWASAGVSIPRTSYEQMSELPAVSTSELQPGDILGFAGNSHVGMYVGDGMLIDSPQTGEDVEKVPLSGWFLANLDGAVAPEVPAERPPRSFPRGPPPPAATMMHRACPPGHEP